MVPCARCGVKTYKKPSQLKKNKNLFCSRKCLGYWTKENRKGVFVDK